MKDNRLIKIDLLIKEKKIKEAQIQLSKLGSNFYKNPDYLYLRSKIFYLNKLYYIAIDTLLVALEFEQSDQIYNLVAEIYNVLGNKKLSDKILSSDSRVMEVKSLKDELSGIYRKNHSPTQFFIKIEFLLLG